MPTPISAASGAAPRAFAKRPPTGHHRRACVVAGGVRRRPGAC
jgi:hypothetical protein